MAHQGELAQYDPRIREKWRNSGALGGLHNATRQELKEPVIGNERSYIQYIPSENNPVGELYDKIRSYLKAIPKFSFDEPKLPSDEFPQLSHQGH
jgi:hypothetical protein